MPHSARMKRIIILPFFVILVTGFGLMWAMYLVSSRAAQRDAVAAIVRESTDRIGEEIRRRMASASIAARGNAAFLATLNVEAVSIDTLQHAFLSQLQADSSVAIFSAGFESGEYAEAQRLQSGALRVASAGKATGGALAFVPVFHDGSFGAVSERRPDYDPRKRPWYANAVKADGPVWSAPYALYSNADLAIAIAMPVRSPDGNLVGVTSATLTLGTLSDYLAGMSEAPNGLMTVVDGEGYLVATSGGSIVDGEGKRIRALDSTDALMATVAASALGTGTPGRCSTVIAGTRYLCRTIAFEPAPGLRWRIIMAVRETAYASRLSNADRTGFAVLSIFLLVSLVVGWLVVDYVTRPIRALVDMVDVLEPGVPAGPGVSSFSGRDNELGRLSRSFLAMKARLDDSFGTLEASLAEKEVLLKEVHHRVKNNLQIVSSILSIQSSTVTDEAARQAFAECQDRIQAMALVHEEVYRTGSFINLEMRGYFERICDAMRYSWGDPGKDVRIELEVGEGAALPLDQAIPCGLIVNELLMNAWKHAFYGRSHGTIRLGFGIDAGSWKLVVADDGVGIGGQKSGMADVQTDASPLAADKADAEGIGSQLVEGLVHQLGGTIDITSRTMDAEHGSQASSQAPVVEAMAQAGMSYSGSDSKFTGTHIVIRFPL